MNAKTFLVASLMTISLVACAKKDDAAAHADSTAANVDSSAMMNNTPTTTTTTTTPVDTTNKAVDVNATPTVSPNSTDTAVMQSTAKNDTLMNKSDSAAAKK